MLWLVKNNKNGISYSYEIQACNIHFNKETNTYQLWVERNNNSNIMVSESKKHEDIAELKEAIDFAIERGETVLRI